MAVQEFVDSAQRHRHNRATGAEPEAKRQERPQGRRAMPGPRHGDVAERQEPRHGHPVQVDVDQARQRHARARQRPAAFRLQGRPGEQRHGEKTVGDGGAVHVVPARGRPQPRVDGEQHGPQQRPPRSGHPLERQEQREGGYGVDAQVQRVVGHHRRKKPMNGGSRQDPRKAAAVVGGGKQVAFEFHQVSKEARVEPGIEVAVPREQGIVLAPEDNGRKQQYGGQVAHRRGARSGRCVRRARHRNSSFP